jgi:hypothetical protein
LLSFAAICKRGSTAASAAADTAAKRAKTADTDASVIGNWFQTKIGDKELSNAEKIGILKNDPAKCLIAGPEIIPRPPPGFRVIFCNDPRFYQILGEIFFVLFCLCGLKIHRDLKLLSLFEIFIRKVF